MSSAGYLIASINYTVLSITLWFKCVVQSNMVSPFAMHQQQQMQLAMLAQQQSILMAAAAAAKSSGGNPKLPSGLQLPGMNGINLPAQNVPNMNQFPGMMMPLGGQADLQKLMQVEHS